VYHRKRTVVFSVPQKEVTVYHRKRTVVFSVPQKERTVYHRKRGQLFSVYLTRRGTVGNYQIRNLIIYALYWVMIGLMGWVRCVMPSTISALLNL
jgi:hypothetical protein